MNRKKPDGQRLEPVGPRLNPGDEAASGTPGTGEDACRTCKGTGRVRGSSCPDCGGTGIVIEGIDGA